MELVVEIYKITEKFPSHERFGLVSQMNRCAISIPSTIAEGAGRNTSKDFDHFLAISLGSSFELHTQLVLSNRLGYVAMEVVEKMELELSHIQKYGRETQKKFECLTSVYLVLGTWYMVQ